MCGKAVGSAFAAGKVIKAVSFPLFCGRRENMLPRERDSVPFRCFRIRGFGTICN